MLNKPMTTSQTHPRTATALAAVERAMAELRPRRHRRAA